MAPESENNLRLEIGHVLFIDLLGYSKLLIEEQKERLGQVTGIVLAYAITRLMSASSGSFWKLGRPPSAISRRA